MSGFILTWSHRPTDTAVRFYRRRFARVYPMHFTTMLLSIPVLLLVGWGISRAELASNVLLVQAWVPVPEIFFGMNSPSWSLSCELLFYLLFPFAIPLLRRLGDRGAGIAFAAAIVLNLVLAAAITALVSNESTAWFLVHIFPPTRLVGFLAGCVLAQWMLSGRRFGQSVGLSAGLLCLGFVGVFSIDIATGTVPGRGVEDAVLLPLILFVIATAAQADIDKKGGALRSRPLRLLGEWSFALYLTHWLLALLLSNFLPPWVGASPLVVRAGVDLAFVVVAIVLSAGFYNAVERPAERRLRGAPPRPAMAEIAGGETRTATHSDSAEVV